LFVAISDFGAKVGRLGEWTFEPSDERDDPFGAAEFVARIRHVAADLIAWLEIKGRSEDAGEVDDAITSMIEVARAFDRGELRAWLPDDDRAAPVEAIDQLREMIIVAASRLEDLDDEIPAEVWEGYDDA
jgi:hypothetical protein